MAFAWWSPPDSRGGTGLDHLLYRNTKMQQIVRRCAL
jgi:hypothetical protein